MTEEPDNSALTTIWYETPNNDRTEVEQLEFRIKVEQDKTKIWDEEAARLRTEIEQLKADYDSRGGEMNSMREALAEAQKLNEILVAEIEQLQAESDISDGLLADAKAEIERLVGIVAALHREIERLFSLWNPNHDR